MSYHITCIIGDNTIELNAMDQDTVVSDLLLAIQRKCGIPPSRQQIFHDNGDIDTTQPDVTLNDLNISNDCRFLILDSNPSVPLQMLPDIDCSNIHTKHKQQNNINTNNISKFDEWIYNNRLSDMTYLLHKHQINTMDTLCTTSKQFRNLMCDTEILISTCNNMIPRLLTAMNSIPTNTALEEGNCPLSGQFHVTVTCSECKKQTYTTEPFMFLSLPIPEYKVIEYTFMDFDKPQRKPIVYGVTLLKTADITIMKQVIARDRCLTQVPFTLLKHLDNKFVFPVFAYIRNICHNLSIKMLPNLILFICVSYYYDAAENEIYICDVWKSKFHRELRRTDAIDDINRKSDDIFVYRSRAQDIHEWNNTNNTCTAVTALKYQTFVIYNQHSVLQRQQYMGAVDKYENEELGFPLLITLPMNVSVTMKQIYKRMWNLSQPYFNDETLKIQDKNKPFEFWQSWGFGDKIQIEYADEILEIADKRNVKFLIHWKDEKYYNGCCFTKRLRDKSAPATVDVNRYGVHIVNESTKQHEIDVHEVLQTYFNESVSESSCCQINNGSSNKVIELFSCPQLLVIHLQRFTNDKNENVKEMSNTLIRFVLDGLDLNKYLMVQDSINENNKEETIYDCYAISNHNQQWNVNNGYIRNIKDNKWYYLDKNGYISKVNNINHMMTSEAYIAYYLKRNSKQKQNLLNFKFNV